MEGAEGKEPRMKDGCKGGEDTRLGAEVNGKGAPLKE